MAKDLELLTTAEVAEALKMDESTVRRLINQGDLPGFKVGKKGRNWRIRRIDLERYMEAQAHAAGEAQG
jgi:excisionase family DNA binding protein